MKWLTQLIARSPGKSIVLGKIALALGGVLVIAGLFGRTGLAGVNAARANESLPAVTRLSQAYPTFPTWFVPEGPIGYVVAGVLVVVGVYITHEAERIRKEKRRGRTQP